jgi:hypothetical protein
MVERSALYRLSEAEINRPNTAITGRKLPLIWPALRELEQSKCVKIHGCAIADLTANHQHPRISD